ncbi:hypothetical protein MMC09_006971 [Bachmanniomyces sp. S44760]|nr:hypothetical protein [Bachmanniomyces sp. S44760]
MSLTASQAAGRTDSPIPHLNNVTNPFQRIVTVHDWSFHRIPRVHARSLIPEDRPNNMTWTCNPGDTTCLKNGGTTLGFVQILLLWVLVCILVISLIIALYQLKKLRLENEFIGSHSSTIKMDVTYPSERTRAGNVRASEGSRFALPLLTDDQDSSHLPRRHSLPTTSVELGYITSTSEYYPHTSVRSIDSEDHASITRG